MTSTFNKKSGSELPRRALNATEIVANLSRLENWTLNGDGPDMVIEKTFAFSNYFETIAFVNAVAFIAHAQDHHPVLTVHFNRCTVAFNTHDVKGLTLTDFACATHVDALLAQ
jgi:4a-hydroxytetrahydrobiopterin dehydratase